jgi:hypothetical protein
MFKLNIFITVLFILLWFLLQCCKFELLIMFATPLCIVDTRVANVTPVLSTFPKKVRLCCVTSKVIFTFYVRVLIEKRE